MPDYYYSNTAVTTALAGSVGSGDTTILVDNAAGYPGSFPFIVALDHETDAEELVAVTSAAGTTWTVTRAFGGTSAQAHSAGAGVKHVVNAVDLQDFRAHEDATTAHGVAGALVGTTDTQTLTNKTLTSPAINAPVTTGGSLAGTISGDPEFTGNPEFSGVPAFTNTPVFEEIDGASALYTRVVGDSGIRLQIGANGRLSWADGTAAADAILYRDSTASLAMVNRLLISRGATGDDCISVRVVGDVSSRLLLEADGKLWFGDGSGSLDVTLYRSAVNLLKTDDVFSAQVETMGAPTAATNFTTVDYSGRRTCGVYTVSLFMQRANSSITANSEGNITDTLMATLPAGWRPPSGHNISASWATGITSGEARVDNTGEVTLRTQMPNSTLGIGHNVLCSFTWIG